jgi:DNA primase
MLEFLRMRDGLTLPEAIERLDGHIRTPSTRTLQPKAQLLQTASRWPVQRDRALFTAAQRFYAGNLRRSHDAKYYLLRRGISLRTAAMLGLGYATGQGLREHLERLGFTLDRIARSGLFQGERERFAGRVTVPDVRHGRVVWLIGRSITDSEPRFQALPGEKPLLGLGRLADLHVVVVTEGVFDWLALIQWGLPACARWDATLLSMQPDPWLLRGRSTWSWTTTSPVGMQLKSFRACSARGPSRCVCLRV